MSAAISSRIGAHVELHGGVISAGPHAGEPIFFVDFIDEEGGRLGIWDGQSYAAACEVVAEWRRDGYPVVYLLGEAQ